MAKRKAATERATGRSPTTSKATPTKKAAPEAPVPSAVIGRKYRRNFLKQVIARIDFASPVVSLAQGPPKSVLSALISEFPVPEQKKQVVQQVVVTDADVQRARRETFQWHFHSKNRDKSVYIGSDAMYVEYKKYDRFESLRRDFLAVSNALFDTFGDLQVRRLGLRYIDNIEFPNEKNPTDWSKYLHKNLLASFHLGDPSTISRAFHVIEFNYGDMSMRFQYGMPNPDFPASIKKKLFTLDYDAYCTALLGREEIERQLTEFHDKLKMSFEEVITDNLRKVMGVIRGK
jgi:uncharacterized protein (TIGR04255 family)